MHFVGNRVPFGTQPYCSVFLGSSIDLALVRNRHNKWMRQLMVTQIVKVYDISDVIRTTNRHSSGVRRWIKRLFLLCFLAISYFMLFQKWMLEATLSLKQFYKVKSFWDISMTKVWFRRWLLFRCLKYSMYCIQQCKHKVMNIVKYVIWITAWISYTC